MKFRLQVIRTSSDGAVVETKTISNEVLRKVSIEETVGDEFFTKASDLNIETNEALTELQGSGVNWLVLYCDDIFFNVYDHPSAPIEYDEKIGHYKYRCDPIQKIFYDDLEATAIEFDGTHPGYWNYELPNTYITIQTIDVEGFSFNVRVGFTIGALLDALEGQDNSRGYFIDEVNHPYIPLPIEDHMPIIWRGFSFQEGVDTDEEIINGTFKASAGGDQFNMKWIDIFKFVIFGWNSFIKIDPEIRWNATLGLYVLGIDVNVIPKIAVTPASQIEEHQITWLERKVIAEKYKIDGVSLTGKNFEYQQGDPDGGNALSRSIDLTDYDGSVEFPDKELYWAEGQWDSVFSEYQLVAPWFASPHEHVQGFYEDMITAGDGISGKCKLIYSDDGAPQILRVLDQVKIGNRTAQLVNIRCDESGIASVEGILLD